METTLEVRWFFQGTLPSEVQRWFERECPGNPLADKEIRTDRYAVVKDTSWFKDLASDVDREGVNLKLRQGNLELKLRQQSSIYRFQPLDQSSIFDGRVEQWCKLSPEELPESVPDSLSHSASWISVKKEREQKIERGVEIELTSLDLGGESWWTIAFEMPLTNPKEPQESCFIEVVERACQSYQDPELSAANSSGYSRWLLNLTV